MLRTRYAKEVTAADDGTEQTIAGWVQAVRLKGNIGFLIVRDQTGLSQAILLKKQFPELFEQAKDLGMEDVVAVTGTVSMSEKANLGWEIKPTQIDVLNKAEHPLPMALWDKGEDAIETGMDTRLDNRFLDLRKPEILAIFRIRNEVIRAGTEHLRANGFNEMHSSNINAASSEGGTEVFKLKYFEQEAFMAQSPQLYKQMMMATGFDRVFEIGWYFRAEKHNTPRHLNESTAFDIEMAFIHDEEDVLQQLEAFFRAIWKAVVDNCTAELAALDVEVKVPSLPFERVPYERALEIINKALDGSAKGRLENPLVFGDDIGTEAERILGEHMAEEGHDFYFITKWPLAPKPFYVMPEDGTMASQTARAFDLDYKGVELLSGAQRIHKVELLKEGLVRVGLKPDDFEGYLTAFRYGMPPHGGAGIGIERILMQMLGLPNIREAILFPRDRHRVYP